MNIFELGWKVFNHWQDIQRVIQLVSPVVNAYNAQPDLVKNVKKVMDQAKPLVDQYSAVEPELIPLITAIMNDLFPTMQSTKKALPRPIGGYDVKWLQSSLNKLIGAKLDADGDYGRETKKAVEKYQKSLVDRKVDDWTKDDVDGWAGMKTCAAIYNDLIAVSDKKKGKS